MCRDSVHVQSGRSKLATTLGSMRRQIAKDKPYTMFLLAVVYLLLLLVFLPDMVSSFLVASRNLAEKTQSPALALIMRLRMSADSDDMDGDDDENGEASSANVLGTSLSCCCANVGGNTGIGTGFYRNGYCSTGEQDLGRHTVCVQVTDDFLEFSKSVGNDLSTPVPQFMFPGLNEGDIWCLCAQRWAEAYNAGKAPKLFLRATHEKTLDYVPFHILREYALDKDEADKALEVLNEQRSKLDKLL